MLFPAITTVSKLYDKVSGTKLDVPALDRVRSDLLTDVQRVNKALGDLDPGLDAKVLRSIFGGVEPLLNPEPSSDSMAGDAVEALFKCGKGDVDSLETKVAAALTESEFFRALQKEFTASVVSECELEPQYY